MVSEGVSVVVSSVCLGVALLVASFVCLGVVSLVGGFLFSFDSVSSKGLRKFMK